MALHGSAFLALWNDFDPARDAEYNCWHTFEHVPERVGIAGILGARRYIARERNDRRYFTLYDLASLAALDGPRYADVADRPTAWSSSMRVSFRNFLRRPCTTVMSVGIGLAGSVATFRFSAPHGADTTTASAALRSQLETSGMSAMHLGVVDTAAKFPVKNAGVDDASGGSPHVLLVEGLDRAELDAASPKLARILRETGLCERDPEWETYDFAFAIDRADLPFPTDRRQPPRPDLRRRYVI